MKGCGGVTKKLVDELLDKMTGGDHSKSVFQIRQVQHIQACKDLTTANNTGGNDKPAC